MLNKKQMDEITTDLMYNVFRNGDIVFDEGEYTIDLLEIIASLHNMQVLLFLFQEKYKGTNCIICFIKKLPENITIMLVIIIIK